MQNPFLGFCSHDGPFDPRLVTVAAWDRLDASREDIENYGLNWYESNVINPRQKAGERLIVTLEQARDRDDSDFNSWCASIVHRFLGRGIVWTYRNEPNLKTFCHWPNPSTYVASAAEFWDRIPHTEVLLLGELSTFDQDYFEGMLAAGSEKVGTGYALHPYGNDPGGQVSHMLKYTTRPVFCTERAINGTSEEQLTDLLVSTSAVKAAGARCHIWYRWPCGAPSDPSFGNGVINPDGTPRALLKALLSTSGTIGASTATS